ncbi:MAG: hypothetical protein ACFB4I_07045 [Cyanophyceae cyanobacterium]
MKLRQLSLKSLQQLLYPLAIVGISLLLYATILIVGVPGRISQLLLSEDTLFLFIASLIFLYFAYLPSGWLGTLTSFAGTLALFGIQLSGIWRSGLNLSAFVLSGLLTMTDTAGYYSSALNFLEGGTFFDISAWRPLAHGVLATLLGLTRQNLQITIALLVLITAIACFFLAREVQRSHGTIPAVFVLIVTFMYYRVYLGTVSTESLGLALGVLGLAFIWRGATKSQSNSCLFGIFLLTLALNTRAGTFFILPALILWGAILFKGSNRFSSRFVLGGFSLVLLAFLLNSLIFKLVSSPEATSFSNFSYSFYGLLVDGNWQTIFKDHPEIMELSNKEATERIYQIIFGILRDDPLSLLRGCIRAWRVFLWEDFVFDFVATADYNNPKLNVGLQILSVYGLVSAYRQRYSPIGSLILASTLGILLSVPFVPPWDAGMRPYMATVSFIALIPAFGVAAIVRQMNWQQLQQIPAVRESSLLLWLLGSALILLTFAGTIVTKFVSYPPSFAKISCPAGMEDVYFRNTSGSSVYLVADDAIDQTNAPHVRIGDFRNMLNRYEQKHGGRSDTTQMIEALSQLPEQTTITNKIDLEDGQMLWAIRPTPLEQPGIIAACGKFANPARLGPGYLKSVFYSDSERIVSRPEAF